MRFTSQRTFLAAVAIAVICLLGVANAGGQAAPAQDAQDAPVMTDDVFKSVQLLKGIPVDTFFEAMGMFASAMGTDCTFCHVSGAYFDKAAFAQPTPRIMRARQMITMMNALNKQYFGGRPRVTCFTCHGGSQSPKSEPDIALQYGPPVEDPNARAFPVDSRFSADQVTKGTYAGFDTAFEKVPVDIAVKAPAQQTMTVHMFNGDSVRTFDGRSGWMAGPDTPLPLMTLTGGNLDGARLDAMLWFPTAIRL